MAGPLRDAVAKPERKEQGMVTEALFVLLKAKTGRELEVENFLKEALERVDEEPGTTAWFALRFGPDTFGIFDVFPDDEARQAHLSGRVASALLEQAPELLAETPTISPADVLAAKLPGVPVAAAQVSTGEGSDR
jgi:quinol monooxygenase YgiN